MYFQIIYFYSSFWTEVCKFQDVYVIAALIFLGLQAAQNATMTALSHFMDDSEVDYFDKWSMVAMAMLLIIFHAIFAAFIYRTVSIYLFRCALCMELAVVMAFSFWSCQFKRENVQALSNPIHQRCCHQFYGWPRQTSSFTW